MKIQMMTAEVKCRRIILGIIALSCICVSTKAQVYISDHKINKTTKCLFSEYETSFSTYRLEDGDIYVDEFIINMELPESGSLDEVSEKDIRKKISTIVIGDSAEINPENLIDKYISEKFLSKYETHKITGDNECNNFISTIKSKNSMLSDEMLWEPAYYGSISGKLIFQTNMFLSYSITEKSCNAMTCIRKETTFVYDIVNKRFLSENDFLLPEKNEAYLELLRNTMTREQKLAYNKPEVNYNSNFYIDEYGLTYVFNSDKYLDEYEATIHVLLNGKYIRQFTKTESVVYKFFNIGQVERAKAKKQNKTIAIN
ncbi:MAG: hypothetical protein II088_07455 [Bacteroidales bacterium]|nr:hypothetical protein [Bacteroidales bacterium]